MCNVVSNPTYCNLLFSRPYNDEHGPKVPITSEYIVLQRVPQKREYMSIIQSILTKRSNKHAYHFKWLSIQSYLNNIFILELLLNCC
jgi:hypothetical protein